MALEFSGVSRRGRPPSAEMTYTAPNPSCRESKTISAESGDQRGVPGINPPKEVTGDGCAPFASQTQISEGPPRFDMNTTRFPSGEYMGLSSRRDEKVNGSGVRLAAASGMRQILVK